MPVNAMHAKPHMYSSVAGVLLSTPGLAHAHAFGRVYALPVPVWMYMYGSAAALLISVLLLGMFVRNRPVNVDLSLAPQRSLALQPLRWAWLSGSLLVGTILTGLVGNQNSYFNFNMTFFWIICCLGGLYLSAVAGHVYQLLNPWQGLVVLIEKYLPCRFVGRANYPTWLAYYPALFFYGVLIWIELFGVSHPLSLSIMLSVYTVINLLAAWWWGAAVWFEQAELFSVLFGVVARMAPRTLQFTPPTLSIYKRRWFAPLFDEPAKHVSLLLFVLFMLSSTAFDGLKETVVWKRLFWGDLFQWLGPQLGDNLSALYPVFLSIERVFNSLALLLSMAVYLGCYWLCMVVMCRITRSTLSHRQMALAFTLTLVPIAFVYNVAHYYTLLFSQGVLMLRLMIDPLGWGWNPLGIKAWLPKPIVLDAGFVWHSQVAIILTGHIISVYLAHMEALRLFNTRRQALISQGPMLVLMVILTSFGLWILSQPISPGNKF